MKPPNIDHRNDAHNFLASGGEMGERVRRFDWSRTPLGPVDQWPQRRRSDDGGRWLSDERVEALSRKADDSQPAAVRRARDVDEHWR